VDEELEIAIYRPEKSACVTCLSGVQHLRIDGPDNFLFYVFPKTPEVKAALQAFFNDEPVPCRTYSDLVRSLRQQLHAVKKARATAKVGKHE
jgi:hypothetical protein